MEPSSALPPRERATRPAGPLAVAALVLGVTAALLGATLVWFFLALPLGGAAIVCALVERRHTRRTTGETAGGIVTAAMVLGSIAIVLSLGGLLVIPRIQGSVEETIDMTQTDVSKDLRSVEKSFNQSVDDLDTTLSNNVDESTQSLESDFASLEESSSEELSQVEERLRAIVKELERSTGSDLVELERATTAELDGFEASLREDLSTAEARAGDVERRLTAEITAIEARLAELEAGTRQDISTAGSGPP